VGLGTKAYFTGYSFETSSFSSSEPLPTSTEPVVEIQATSSWWYQDMNNLLPYSLYCYRRGAINEAFCRSLDLTALTDHNEIIYVDNQVLDNGFTQISSSPDAAACFHSTNGTWRCLDDLEIYRGYTGFKNLVLSDQSYCGILRDVALGDQVQCAANLYGAAAGARGDGVNQQTLTSLEGVVGTARASLPKQTVQLTGGRTAYCALLEDHSVWCWGNNSNGALGDGTLETRYTPVRVVF
jgi:hypothetical protein